MSFVDVALDGIEATRVVAVALRIMLGHTALLPELPTRFGTTQVLYRINALNEKH